MSKVNESKIWIKDKFKSLNIRSNFNGGNYFLIWPKKDPNILESQMRLKGILVRNMKNKKDIENSLRVSIGTYEQMLFFWNVYKDLENINF